jgi:hypothetical protein
MELKRISQKWERRSQLTTENRCPKLRTPSLGCPRSYKSKKRSMREKIA